MPTDLKAPRESAEVAGQPSPSSPLAQVGPREFCNRRCRRDFHHAQEQASIKRERAEEQERLKQEYETRVYGPPYGQALGKGAGADPGGWSMSPAYFSH